MVEVPPNPLVVVRVEVGERSGAQVGTAVRRLQCVAASNSHIPEHYPSRCLFLPLDVESTWKEIPSDNARHHSRKKNCIRDLQSSKENFSAVFLCSISGNTCSLRYFSLCLRFSQP